MHWDLYLNFLLATLSIINPVGILPLWTELTGDHSRDIRKRTAFLIIGTSLLIVIIFLWTGKYLLQFFSIDLPVFKIAGGILLLITGISMVNGNATQVDKEEEDGGSPFEIAKNRFRHIIVPMAIPSLAGPGSITTMVLFGSNASNILDFVSLTVVTVITFSLLLLTFIYSSWLESKLDPIVFNVITRLFGVIVTAIAVQFMVEGLGTVFPNWMEGVSPLEQANTSQTSTN